MWAGSGCVYERSERKTNHSPLTLGAKRPTAIDRAGAARATARGTGRERKRLGPLSGGAGAGRQWRPTPAREPAGPPARSRAPPATQKHTHAYSRSYSEWETVLFWDPSLCGYGIPPSFMGGYVAPRGQRGRRTSLKAREPKREGIKPLKMATASEASQRSRQRAGVPLAGRGIRGRNAPPSTAVSTTGSASAPQPRPQGRMREGAKRPTDCREGAKRPTEWREGAKRPTDSEGAKRPS